ncbi:MAG: N-acetyltransferase [Bacteroidales bacterium]|nr:MAG: N-acetyltransferase [Bacteroidales bacterium]
MNNFKVLIASASHLKYVVDILTTIEESAKVRGTGIAQRKPEYIQAKINEGKAVIALNENDFAGFCYIETWGHGQFVANSGLIVKPEYRGQGLAKLIKQEVFKLSKEKYPNAKIFGLTTGLAVMKINTSLGYRPVTFSELTDDAAFWDGCQSCVNFDILQRTNRKICLCTGMLYDPTWEENAKETDKRQHSYQVYSRWFKLKYHILSRLKKTKAAIAKVKKKAA